ALRRPGAAIPALRLPDDAAHGGAVPRLARVDQDAHLPRAMRRFVPVLVAALAAGAAPAHAATEQLPDLDQVAPYDVSATSQTPPFHLGFASAVENVGQGPLIIHGHRANTSDPMVAKQIVNTDGSPNEYDNVGTLQFVQSEDHNHWH